MDRVNAIMYYLKNNEIGTEMKYSTLPCKNNCITLAICKFAFKESYMRLYKSGYAINHCSDRSLTILVAKCDLLIDYLNATGSGKQSSESNFNSKRHRAERFFREATMQGLPDIPHM